MSVAAAKNRVAQAEKALAAALRTLEEAEQREYKRKQRERCRAEARQRVNAIGADNLVEWYKCERKAVYITETLAVVAQTDRTLNAYLCIYCTGWHNGHGTGGSNPNKSSLINAMTQLLIRGQKINS